MTPMNHAPQPWTYEYNPYIAQDGSEIPAFQINDADGAKVFDTNEDASADLQEANARLGSTAPRLLASLITCANLLADHDELDGEEGVPWREAMAAIAAATGRAA